MRSLYQFRVLLRFCDELGFHLAQEFFWHNPSKLPSPIEWVNKRKLRAKGYGQYTLVVFPLGMAQGKCFQCVD